MEKQHKTTIRQPIRQPDSFGNVCIWANVGIEKLEKVNSIETFQIRDLQESPKYTHFQGNRVVLWVVLWLSYVAFPQVLGCLMVVLWDSLDQTHSFYLASWPGVIGGSLHQQRSPRPRRAGSMPTGSAGLAFTLSRVDRNPHRNQAGRRRGNHFPHLSVPAPCEGCVPDLTNTSDAGPR